MKDDMQNMTLGIYLESNNILNSITLPLLTTCSLGRRASSGPLGFCPPCCGDKNVEVSVGQKGCKYKSEYLSQSPISRVKVGTFVILTFERILIKEHSQNLHMT